MDLCKQDKLFKRDYTRQQTMLNRFLKLSNTSLKVQVVTADSTFLSKNILYDKWDGKLTREMQAIPYQLQLELVPDDITTT